jgi:hypothetical protein
MNGTAKEATEDTDRPASWNQRSNGAAGVMDMREILQQRFTTNNI